jgi:hypothetical protein
MRLSQLRVVSVSSSSFVEAIARAFSAWHLLSSRRLRPTHKLGKPRQFQPKSERKAFERSVTLVLLSTVLNTVRQQCSAAQQ